MLALTIRFCFPPIFLPVQDQDGLAADVFSPQKGYLEPPSLTSVIRRVEAAIADSSRSSSGGRSPLRQRIGATPRGQKRRTGGRRAKFLENSSPNFYDILRQRFVCSLSASCTIRGRAGPVAPEKVLRSRSKTAGAKFPREWRSACANLADRTARFPDGGRECMCDQMVRMLRAVDMLCTATGVTKGNGRGLEVDKRTVDRLLGSRTSINRLCAEVNRRILARVRNLLYFNSCLAKEFICLMSKPVWQSVVFWAVPVQCWRPRSVR